MAAELGETTEPTNLVPGNVGTVADTMWAMRAYGDSLHDAGAGLKRIDTTEGWSGQAAEQFRDVFQGQPTKWLTAGDCFHDAANALDHYDSTLRWAQGQAKDAIRLWNEGEAATAKAKAAQSHADPTTVFTDPGEAKRQHARELLGRARSQLHSAGDTAAKAVGAARDKAPEKPGFWSRVGSGLGHFFTSAGHAIENVGIDAVNGLASFGNAMVNHPGDMAALVGGAALTAVSGLGDGVGGVLDATGIGAVAGVPLNVVSTAGVVTGVGIMTAATGDLANHAATDDSVSPLRHVSEEPEPPNLGRSGTKTDRLKEHLTDRDLEAAQRESRGEVVKRKPNGEPWDHVDEVQNAQRGLVKRIEAIKRQLGDSRISDADRAELKSELGEASRLLDHSENYLPRH